MHKKRALCKYIVIVSTHVGPGPAASLGALWKTQLNSKAVISQVLLAALLATGCVLSKLLKTRHRVGVNRNMAVRKIGNRNLMKHV